MALVTATFSSVAANLASAQGASVTVTRLADMSFGDVVAGTSSSLATTDANASVFRLDCSSMTGQQTVSVTLTLPNQIANGSEAIPATFGVSDAAWSYTNDPTTATTFDPRTGTVVVKNGNPFTIYVWVGGRIDPAPTTPSNPYTSTLTLDAQIQ